MPVVALVLLAIVLLQAIDSFVPVVPVAFFPPAVPQVFLALLLGIVAFVVALPAVLRRALAIAMLLVVLSAGLIAYDISQAVRDPSTAESVCIETLSALSPERRAALAEISGPLQAPTVHIDWTGDLTCDWSASRPAEAEGDTTYTVSAWETIRFAFSVQAQ